MRLGARALARRPGRARSARADPRLGRATPPRRTSRTSTSTPRSGRSLASQGRPLIRGRARISRPCSNRYSPPPSGPLASTETAYHLVQAENAVFMSLAAVPVYLLARRLGLGAGYALACAAFALAIPDLAFAGFDPLRSPGLPARAGSAVCSGSRARRLPARPASSPSIAFAGCSRRSRASSTSSSIPAFVAAASSSTAAPPSGSTGSRYRDRREPAAGSRWRSAPARLLGYYSAVRAPRRPLGASSAGRGSTSCSSRWPEASCSFRVQSSGCPGRASDATGRSRHSSSSVLRWR